jgi:hypothetical protein
MLRRVDMNTRAGYGYDVIDDDDDNKDDADDVYTANTDGTTDTNDRVKIAVDVVVTAGGGIIMWVIITVVGRRIQSSMDEVAIVGVVIHRLEKVPLFQQPFCQKAFLLYDNQFALCVVDVYSSLLRFVWNGRLMTPKIQNALQVVGGS